MMHSSVDRDSRRITLVGSAPFTLDDVDAGIRARVGPEVWSFPTLIDFRGVGDWLPTRELVESYAHRMRSFEQSNGASRGPVAFVVTHAQPALYGMLRMYSMIAELHHGAHVGVFYSVKDAETWLTAL
jgi:hypothetical protein